jgi:hypothetical protein
MDTGLTPTSELEAVNQMLLAVGETPVNTLDDDESSDSGECLALLRITSKALQNKGWNFNTDEEMPLAPNSVDGTISLPFNCLRFRASGVDRGTQFTYRAGKVYDRVNNTFTISRTIYATVTSLLPYEDMPEDARHFVMVSAARMFQDKRLGDSQLHQFDSTDEASSWASFLASEAEDDNYNVVRDSPSVSSVVRGRYRYVS